MRACFAFLFLLATTFALSVKSKPHGKHHRLHKASHFAKEKDIITEEANKPQVLPTLVPFEASSRGLEDEELSSEGNANASKEGELEAAERRDGSAAVLMSDDELAELLKREEEEEEGEEGALQEEEVDKGKSEVERAMPEEQEEDESEGDAEVLEKEEAVVQKISADEGRGVGEEPAALFEETDGSTESEIPADLDYAADSGLLQPLPVVSTKLNPSNRDIQTLPNAEELKKIPAEKVLAATGDEAKQDAQNVEDDKVSAVMKEQSSDAGARELSESEGAEAGREVSEKEEEEKGKNESGSHSKVRARKQRKTKRARKHSPQSDEPQVGQEQSQQEAEAASSSSSSSSSSSGGGGDNAVQKAKRRRAGKWGPLVGMNPVQIRATVDLYPSSRSSLGAGASHGGPEAPVDPCDNFPCKRGKMCKLDSDNKPGCVCQEPAECPASVNEYDHVCGTDNKTYDTSCELFATKCKLEGTKKGHRLHLDYTGSCKLIPECVDPELVQFPLRMRDWLKNVLLQLYEHDAMSPGFLTPKQRFRVKKIFESERRLHAGDHSVELLAQDFEKNYNMYIYPVHWQFAQLDQHPSDRFLSHSELAPLRVPLVPMEHCTSRFFQECDADKDKQVSFKEWTSCFGIKNEDMDINQLF
ncbi:SPARC-like protein 1 [Nelusetta ayraudi]|uniref:SPARC-like protein 1 n=1 Tax=Nelusetta ayraudi TaxID=303726 RepID=UPI003F70D667